ncbi:ABC transporter permease subunit [Nitratireductor alexandrii]|uniref:branched-chain amino acid ABC transporter ATP-binding protein/permease n=1 Tax=Nitratireductor alexandrii TaxID=2448161 RepID=UPI000FD97854|nr:branched-chain amino acid ABC transporter ATP-binding protein/permease [Nitratireductor alexandrii]
MRLLVLAAGLAAAALIPTLTGSAYILDVLAYGGVLALFALSVAIVVGQIGFITFGHAAFLGLGAYTSAILAPTLGYWVTVPLALLPGVVFGIAFGALSARLNGAYFAIATLVIAGLLEYFAANLVGLTNGPMGLLAMPESAPGTGLVGWNDAQGYLFWVLAVLVLAWAGLANLVAGPMGRRWHATRDDPNLAESLGVPTRWVRMRAMAVSGALASLAGALLVPKIIVVSPTVFGIDNSAIGVLAVIFGGRATLAGPVIGGALFAILPEMFRGIGELNTALFALILLATVVVFPGGLMSVLDLLPRRKPKAEDAPEPVSDQDMAQALPEKKDRPDCAPILTIEGVSRQFGGLTAVDNVDLTVAEGEILGLIGPNGAGKTTFFTMLSGFQTVSAGSIHLRGEDIIGLAPHKIAAKGLVRTFQHSAVFPRLSVVENMLCATNMQHPSGFWATLLKTPRYRREEAERRRIVRAGLAEVGLSHRAHDAAVDLPYGEQKLLGVGMALMVRPDLLLLDEPAAGLNMVEANRLRDVLADLRDRGMTILIVDHNLTMLMSFVDRIAVLHHGRKIGDGAPAEIARQADVVEAYLGGSKEGENA